MKTIPFTESEINHIKELYTQELERLQKRTLEITSLLNKFESAEKTEVISAKKVTESKTPEKLKRNKIEKKENSIGNIPEQPTQTIEAPKAKRGRPFAIKAETDSAKTKKAIIEPIGKIKIRGNHKSAEKVKAIVAPKTDRKIKEKTAKIDGKVASEQGKRGRKKEENSKSSQGTAAILQILEKKRKVITSRDIIEEFMKIQNISPAEFNNTRNTIAGGLSNLKLKSKHIKSISIAGQKGELYGLSQWFDDAGQLLDESRR
jgi:hypothetical protein